MIMFLFNSKYILSRLTNTNSTWHSLKTLVVYESLTEGIIQTSSRLLYAAFCGGFLPSRQRVAPLSWKKTLNCNVTIILVLMTG